MISAEQNDRYTKVGPGTPMGELMRRYWHPIAASAQLDEENPTKEIRILGEDLLLYRDLKGRVGCIEPTCAHRKANLSYGIPEENGLRCAYHGWIYNQTGACVEQPSEPSDKKFHKKVCLKAYPAEELGGLIFVYMGPQPQPLLPRWDLLVWDNVTRNIRIIPLPCNWLQCVDNALDPVHFQWLHAYWGAWSVRRNKPPEEREEFNRQAIRRGRRHLKVGFNRFEYGIIKRRLMEGITEEDEYWRIGHPILFPNFLRVSEDYRHTFQYRVPVDDTHTMHVYYVLHVPKPGEKAPPQDPIPYTLDSPFDEKGRLKSTTVPAQDEAAWIMQGPVTDRTTEHLGATDVGLFMYRKLIEEQFMRLEQGKDPINVHRDPDKNKCITIATEHTYYPGYTRTGGPFVETPLVRPDVEVSLE